MSVFSAMVVAYEDSNGASKYIANGCNWLIESFPNNTQLLRPYVGHDNAGASLLMVGDSDS